MHRYLAVAITLACSIVPLGVASAAPSGRPCMDCHDQGAVVDGVDARPPVVDGDGYRRSSHGKLTCSQCHPDAEVTGEMHAAKLAKVNCSSCHEKEARVLSASLHGGAGNDKPVACKDCHGSHDILSADDPKSTLYPTNVPDTCGACHAGDANGDSTRRKLSPLDSYRNSVHFTALTKGGLVVTATCVSCHGGHDTARTDNKHSRVSRDNLPETCGNCHLGVWEGWEEGVHGKAVRRGEWDAPSCTDCHGDHSILATDDPKSRVYATTISKDTCGRCHESEHMRSRYGLQASQVETYKDSFHGLADQFGETTVANCASCHDAHRILPSTDPASTVHASNLPATCGKCHPGAGDNFAKGAVHRPSEARGGAVLTWARIIYIGMIVGTIGFMALHNLLDYYATLRDYYRINRRRRRYLRFVVGERLQHVVLVLTFFVLVITGFALKYPEASWVKLLVDLGMTSLMRGYAHRAAAILFMVLCVYHAWYLVATKRGRDQLKEMLPRRSDASEVWHQMRYYLGFEKHGAQFGRYGYIEKSEYLALVWGSLVMIVTGLILWFEEGALGWMPKWGWDLSELIHLYEAWLATLAIIVWHFYHVAFKPSLKGMSLAMVTGELPEEAMAHEHGRELEELKAKASQEAGADEATAKEQSAQDAVPEPTPSRS